MTTLRSVVARLASLVRCAGIAYIAVQVAVWHSYYAAAPWRLAGPVAASVWGAVSRTTTVATILLAMVAGVHLYGRRALSGRAASPCLHLRHR
jgi:hypothetical protein